MRAVFPARFFSASLLALYAAIGGPATAGSSLFDAQPLDDAELAEARGGFALPNGLTLDFGVMVTTIVDGAKVLETQLRVVGDTVSTSVTQAVGTGGAAGNDSGSGATLTVPIVDVTTGGGVTVGDSVSASVGQGGSSATGDNSGIGVTPGGGVQVNIGTVNVATTPGGTPQVSFDAGGAGSAQSSIDTAAANTGYVVTTGTGAGSRIDVSAKAVLPQLLIEHEIGRSISSYITNTGDGRVIDNRLTIDLSIGNAQPYSIGSSGFRVQSIGLDAAAWRGSGG